VAESRQTSLATADRYLAESRGHNIDQLRKFSKFLALYWRCLAQGFAYRPLTEIIADGSAQDILSRLQAISGLAKTNDASFAIDALLGDPVFPKLRIRQALNWHFYQNRAKLTRLSTPQRKIWKYVRQRAVRTFIDLHGDMEVDQIKRIHAQDHFSSWSRKIASGGKAAKSVATVNSEMRAMSQILSSAGQISGAIGLDDPYRSLRFERRRLLRREPLSVHKIHTKMLGKGCLSSLNLEARCALYVLIETGCHLSEVATLRADDVCLNANPPFLRIRVKPGTQGVCPDATSRVVPLVGIALRAMKTRPSGFDRYRHRPAVLSSTLLAGLRREGALTGKNEHVSSLRLSYADRLRHGGVEKDLASRILGKVADHWLYARNDNIAKMHEHMLRIALPFDRGLVPEN